MRKRVFLKRQMAEVVSNRFMQLLTAASALILLVMAIALIVRSLPLFKGRSLWQLLFSSQWYPLKNQFGFFPFIVGTLWVTGVAVLIAVPLCLLTAIFLSEYAPRRVREWIAPMVDLLAGIPSVIYGVWGVLVIVPIVKNQIAPFFGKYSTGYSVLAGGMVLAVMIVPIIIHISLEVFRTVPREMRDASLALGATRWETVKYVVLKKSMPGIVAAVVLGISRAFGETMAVLMVVGNVSDKLPKSVFDPAYPLPALIANHYGEMLSIPKYDSALIFAALVLLLVVLVFNVATRFILRRLGIKEIL